MPDDLKADPRTRLPGQPYRTPHTRSLIQTPRLAHLSPQETRLPRFSLILVAAATLLASAADAQPAASPVPAAPAPAASQSAPSAAPAPTANQSAPGATMQVPGAK